ncbi:MAG: GNAT family N-acetyltransferase [Lachnospiraceae bacterium]|nr:GNAT family N-acetyltransferase [Lachnospiraceae bacterium]
MQHKGTRKLETERLILRQFRIEDAETMYRNWASDDEVTRYLTWPTHDSPELTKTLVMDWLNHYSESDYYNWAIELKETKEVIGNISVVRIQEELSSTDIGYCMGKAWWGNGIMPEALRAVIGYLFNKVQVNRIAAAHDVHNPKSGRVMEKADMKLEGILRASGRNNQGICDMVWHSILKQEYER